MLVHSAVATSTVEGFLGGIISGGNLSRELSYLLESTTAINPLDSKLSHGNYSATSNDTKLVHWPLMDGLLHLLQRLGAWAACGPAQSPPRCIPNVTAHPSTASVPITILLYDRPLLCGFNVGIKGLTRIHIGNWLRPGHHLAVHQPPRLRLCDHVCHFVSHSVCRITAKVIKVMSQFH